MFYFESDWSIVNQRKNIIFTYLNVFFKALNFLFWHVSRSCDFHFCSADQTSVVWCMVHVLCFPRFVPSYTKQCKDGQRKVYQWEWNRSWTNCNIQWRIWYDGLISYLKYHCKDIKNKFENIERHFQLFAQIRVPYTHVLFLLFVYFSLRPFQQYFSCVGG